MSSTTTQTRTKDLWERANNKWHQSTMNFWHRSPNAWSESKYRCHQTTMETWHRPADTCVNSKSRCRPSAAEASNQSASQRHQPTERFYRCSLPLSELKESTTSTQSKQLSESSQPPKFSQSSRSATRSDTDSMERRQASIDILENTQKTPEEQIQGLLDWTDRVVHQASQAKQLENTQAESLGEIEHNWINSTICDADNAARDLTKLVEPYRLDMLKHKGRMKAANRKRWSFGDSQLAREKLSGLTLFQSRLDRVCNHLQGVRSLPKTPIQGCDGETVAEPPIEIFECLPSFPCEASSFESRSTTIVAELDTSPVVKIGSPISLPKIIVTRPPDEITLDHVEIPDVEQPSQESHEIDDALYWDETRNSIRMQQSESLSNIVAKMELTRIK